MNKVDKRQLLTAATAGRRKFGSRKDTWLQLYRKCFISEAEWRLHRSSLCNSVYLLLCLSIS